MLAAPLFLTSALGTGTFGDAGAVVCTPITPEEKIGAAEFIQGDCHRMCICASKKIKCYGLTPEGNKDGQPLGNSTEACADTARGNCVCKIP